MKNFSIKEFFSANPYRDWVLILSFLFVLVSLVVVLDVRFFLSATQKASTEGKGGAVSLFDKEALKRAVSERRAQEESFNNLNH